jgi:predicted small secreted protein
MKTNKVQIMILASFTALFAVAGSGCNTMNGAGKDIEKAGNKIQDAAK